MNSNMFKFQDSIEYQILPIPFTVLTLCGTWCPANASAKEKRLYGMFTITILFLGIVLNIEIIVNLILTRGTDKFSLDNVFASIVFVIGIYKKINIVYQRQRMMDFICEYVNSEWYKSTNSIENTIYFENQVETRWVSFSYSIFILMAILLRSVMPILESGTFIILPLEAWYPYSVDNFFAFWLSYCHQLISGVTLSCMHLCSDTLFVGLLLQMNYQINILKYRLKEIGNPTFKKDPAKAREIDSKSIKRTIGELVRQHEYIFRFGNNLQEIFKPILIGQIIIVVPNLIINIYFLSVSTDKLNLQYLMTLFFAVVSVMQIYMLCWYGNEIVLGCLDIGDAMYQCNWISFDASTKRTLLTILARSSKAFTMTACAAVPLNIDVFIKIMKTSYSAFNILQQTVAQ